MVKFETVEDIEFDETKVTEVDELFEGAKEPVNNMVDTSNGLTKAVRSFKQLIAAEAEGDDAKPLGVAKLTLKDGLVGLSLTCPMGNPLPKPPKQAAGGFKRVNKKCDLVNKRLTKLKAQDDTWAITLVDDGNSAELTRGTGVEKDMKDMERSWSKLTSRFADLQEDLLPQVEFAAVVKEGVSQLSKADIKPKLDVNFDDVASPQVGIVWDEEKAMKAAEKKPVIKKIKEAFQALIDAIKKIFEFIPGFITQIKELLVKATEFPSKIKDMASAAGLGLADVAKAVSKLTSNLKNLKGVPSTCNGVMNNSKTVVEDLKAALEGKEEMMSEEMMPDEMADEAMPEKAMEGEAMPEKAMEGEAMPEKAMEGEAMPEKAMEGEAMPEKAMEPGEAEAAAPAAGS